MLQMQTFYIWTQFSIMSEKLEEELMTHRRSYFYIYSLFAVCKQKKTFDVDNENLSTLKIE